MIEKQLTQLEIASIIWDELECSANKRITKVRARQIVRQHRSTADRLSNIIKHLDPNIFEDGQYIRIVEK